MNPLEAARAWRRDGHYDLGLACLRELAEDAPALTERARLLVRQGKASDGRRAAEAALALAEAADADGPAVEEAWLALCEAALAAGDPGMARAAVETALPRVRARWGEVSLPTALALDSQAAALQAMGDPAGALAPATRAAAILDQLGAPAYDRAQVAHTLAECWHRAGRYAEARDAWTETLRLRREALPPDHPEIAAALDGLGLSLRRLNRLKESVAAHREALSLARARLGPWHPALAASNHGLAQALRRAGDFQGARESLRAALAISERCQGPDHPDTLVTRFELGRIEVDCGDFEGFGRMEAARAQLRALLGPGHPTVQAMNAWL